MPAPAPRTAYQGLAAPDRAVRPQTGAIPGEDDPVALAPVSIGRVFRRQSRRVRGMMEDGHDGQAPVAREPCGGKAGMRVAADRLGPDAVQRQQILRRPLQQRDATRRVHVAQVRRDHGRCPHPSATVVFI